ASCTAMAADEVGEIGPPFAGREPVAPLIEPREEHFVHLWKVTSGGNNAEAYWSFGDDRLVLQRSNEDEDVPCDRIYLTDPDGGGLLQLSSGAGVTTCGFFLPGDEQVLFASTHAGMEGCPPPTDHSRGYVWPIHAEYDIWVRDLASDDLRRFTDVPGYDAEATISPQGDRIVFTSTRSGDLELWTSDLEGGDLRQVTDRLGYDGGAFFSHDGSKLVFRATVFAPEAEAEEQATYRELLADWLVRPHALELFVVDADGSNRRQVTNLGQANWAPYFFPSDERILFASNYHDPDPSDGINFDLFAIDEDGTDLEQITFYDGFDSFAMFSHDGRYVAFASNRGGSEEGETNVFVAAWR
ncbi:MAG: hypothetical protein O7B99_11590, partial [Planctomycetota bacterium]|nr:hypothetical protein [Planctomycetota bacterium]